MGTPPVPPPDAPATPVVPVATPAPAGAPRAARSVPPALYLVVILCFFLPFVTVSCANIKLATLTGVDLVIGKDVEPPKELQDALDRVGGGTGDVTSTTNRQEPEVLAIAAAAVAVLALVLAFVPRRPVRIAGMVLGIATAVLVFSLRFRFKLDTGDVPAEATDVLGGANPIQITYGIGYWAAIVVALAAAAVQLWLVLRPPAGEEAAPPKAPPAPPPVPSTT